MGGQASYSFLWRAVSRERCALLKHPSLGIKGVSINGRLTAARLPHIQTQGRGPSLRVEHTPSHAWRSGDVSGRVLNDSLGLRANPCEASSQVDELLQGGGS